MSDSLFAASAAPFYGLLVLLLLAETYWCLQTPVSRFSARCSSNVSLALAGMLLTTVAAPLAGSALAAIAATKGIGLLNLVSLPSPVALVAALLLLDLFRYAEHRLTHAIPILWRCHLVHHSDVDVDVTTHLRHHPFEFAIVLMTTAVAVFAIGPPVAAVLLYAVVANFLGALQHANLRFPPALERVLQPAVLTPGLHRVHHSSRQPETDSNFGTLLSVWDRLFGTLVASPHGGFGQMRCGIGDFAGADEQWPQQVLMQPLRWKKRTSAAPGPATER